MKIKIPIRFLFLLMSISCISSGLQSQQNHFIYIQTENKKPFYVKQDKKIYSSSATGYLIISKLMDGEYNFTIGFPKNEWPEQNLTLTVNKKDLGYSLKNFGDKGWGLFNLQTLDIVMAGNKTNVDVAKKEVTDDPFNNMLSNAVNDPSIKEKKEEEKALQKVESKIAEPTVQIKKEEIKITEDPAPVNNQEIKTLPSISRVLSNTNNEGTELMYIDRSTGKEDTIRLFIPIDKIIVSKDTESVKEEIKKEELKAIVKEDPPKDKKFIDMELPNPNSKPDPVKEEELKISSPVVIAEKPKNELPAITTMPNSDCKNFATEEDFMKLRKKMAAEENDDDMITIAKKIFKSKCFTTEQVKNLSVLFLKDKGRYDFFDAAYPFVADSNNFPSLENQLTDIYFINRFKVMIKH